MAKRIPTQSAPTRRAWQALEPHPGTVRECLPYAGEMARHRLITADGCDYVVATLVPQHAADGYVTAAYPVSRGYLVMVRQPLCELRSAATQQASEQHERLVRVLAQAGVKLVRARRALAARHRRELSLMPDLEVSQPIRLATLPTGPSLGTTVGAQPRTDGELALN
jgi:hypothetical protein